MHFTISFIKKIMKLGFWKTQGRGSPQSVGKEGAEIEKAGGRGNIKGWAVAGGARPPTRPQRTDPSHQDKLSGQPLIRRCHQGLVGLQEALCPPPPTTPIQAIRFAI